MKNGIIEVKDGKVREAIISFLRDLFEKDLLDALLVPKEVPSKDNVVQTLVTDVESLIGANPIAPVMPVNSARIVSDMTKVTPSKKRIGIILRPCELRALVELVKLKQASLENLIIIGLDCLGTYSVTSYAQMISEGKDPTKNLLMTFKLGEDPDLRSACRICEYPVPQNYDITIGLVGLDFENTISVQANTKVGEQIIGKLDLKEFKQDKERENAISTLIKARITKRDEAFAKRADEISGWDKLSSVFATCINCHNCMNVCPICYCKECFFESPTFEFESDQYLGWAMRKGSIRLPTDTVLFHLTRMNHMALSCVGCGVCEQACPNDIPLLEIFRLVGSRVQGTFDYVPGRSLEEELPLAVFKEDELQSVGK
jgi:formate dehydrogenase subunit beta